MENFKTGDEVTATKAFQTLIEISAAVCHGGLTPDHGFGFYEKFGEFLAKHLIDKKTNESDINFYANILYDFCDMLALMRFAFEVEAEGFSVPYDFENGDNFIIKGHKGLNRRATIDIGAMALHGKKLGWKREWCPFEKPYADLWYLEFSKGADL